MVLTRRYLSLEALENFIQSQKALLERTHADIERLKELRKDVEQNPPTTLDDLSAKVCVYLSYMSEP